MWHSNNLPSNTIVDTVYTICVNKAVTNPQASSNRLMCLTKELCVFTKKYKTLGSNKKKHNMI